MVPIQQFFQSVVSWQSWKILYDDQVAIQWIQDFRVGSGERPTSAWTYYWMMKNWEPILTVASFSLWFVIFINLEVPVERGTICIRIFRSTGSSAFLGCFQVLGPQELRVMLISARLELLVFVRKSRLKANVLNYPEVVKRQLSCICTEHAMYRTDQGQIQNGNRRI